MRAIVLIPARRVPAFLPCARTLSGGRESRHYAGRHTPPSSGDELLAAVTEAMVGFHQLYHHREPVTAKTLMLGDDLIACVLGGVYTDVEKTMIEIQKDDGRAGDPQRVSERHAGQVHQGGRGPVRPRRAGVRLKPPRGSRHRNRTVPAQPLDAGAELRRKSSGATLGLLALRTDPDDVPGQMATLQSENQPAREIELPAAEAVASRRGERMMVVVPGSPNASGASQARLRD